MVLVLTIVEQVRATFVRFVTPSFHQKSFEEDKVLCLNGPDAAPVRNKSQGFYKGLR